MTSSAPRRERLVDGAPSSDGDSGAAAPSITVAICAYTLGRWTDLCAAVDSVLAQGVPPLEVLVVVDHNPELFEKASARWRDVTRPARVAVVENLGRQGLSGGRNTALGRAAGEIIVFLDDDAAAAPGWLERLCEPFAATDVVAAGGSARAALRAPRPGWWPGEFDWVIGCSWTGLPSTQHEVRNVIGCNMAMRRTSLVAVGGFAEGIGRVGTRALGCEETDVCIRLRLESPGARVVYVPDAVVDHAVPASRLSARYFFDRAYCEGLSKALVVDRVGTERGLESERSYATRTLPRGIRNGVRDGVRGDRAGFGRALVIAGGFSTTCLGYVVGRAQVHPIHERLSQAVRRASRASAAMRAARRDQR